MGKQTQLCAQFYWKRTSRDVPRRSLSRFSNVRADNSRQPRFNAWPTSSRSNHMLKKMRPRSNTTNLSIVILDVFFFKFYSIEMLSFQNISPWSDVINASRVWNDYFSIRHSTSSTKIATTAIDFSNIPRYPHTKGEDSSKCRKSPTISVSFAYFLTLLNLHQSFFFLFPFPLR